MERPSKLTFSSRATARTHYVDDYEWALPLTSFGLFCALGCKYPGWMCQASSIRALASALLENRIEYLPQNLPAMVMRTAKGSTG